MLAAVSDTLGAAAADDGARRVLEALEAAVTDASQLEGSVRHGGAAGLLGGRIMIERAPAALARTIATVLGAQLKELDRLAEAAAAEGVGLIAGWDVGGRAPLAKLYANASDAAAKIRSALAARLGLHGAPHVIGVNASAGGAQWKVYRQDPDTAALADEVGGAAPWLARLAEGLAVAGVASWDVGDGALTPRAFFVAIGTPDAQRARAVVDALPGGRDANFEAALGFDPGPVRSIGVSAGNREHWTVYFKPRRADDPVYALDPVAAFRVGDVEVGVYVEPLRPDGRAYATTDRYAISYRTRDGAPQRVAVEALMGWVVARVRAAERAGATSFDLSAPPEPWNAAGA